MHPAVLLVTGLLAGLIWLSFLRHRAPAGLPSALGAVAAIVGLGLLLIVGTRIHWGIGSLAAMLALPMLHRLWRTVQASSGRYTPSPGQTSTVETAHIRMVVDHGSGEMTGEVLRGSYAGCTIEALDVHALRVVLGECRQDDPQGAQVIESYLDRHYAGWAEGPDASGSTSERADTGGHGNMSAGEALNILGLDDGATDEAIVDAHRRLMQKVHPDRGGSSFLAAQINRAKDVLLG